MTGIVPRAHTSTKRNDFFQAAWYISSSGLGVSHTIGMHFHRPFSIVVGGVVGLDYYFFLWNFCADGTHQTKARRCSFLCRRIYPLHHLRQASQAPAKIAKRTFSRWLLLVFVFFSFLGFWGGFPHSHQGLHFYHRGSEGQRAGAAASVRVLGQARDRVLRHNQDWRPHQPPRLRLHQGRGSGHGQRQRLLEVGGVGFGSARLGSLAPVAVTDSRLVWRTFFCSYCLLFTPCLYGTGGNRPAWPNAACFCFLHAGDCAGLRIEL